MFAVEPVAQGGGELCVGEPGLRVGGVVAPLVGQVQIPVDALAEQHRRDRVRSPVVNAHGEQPSYRAAPPGRALLFDIRVRVHPRAIIATVSPLAQQ